MQPFVYTWFYLITPAQVVSLLFSLGDEWVGNLSCPEWAGQSQLRIQPSWTWAWVLGAGPVGQAVECSSCLHLGNTGEPGVAAENAEAPGLIKVVITMCTLPFHLQRLCSHRLLIPPIAPNGWGIILSSQFADGEVDGERGLCQELWPLFRGNSWLPASNLTWADGKTEREV